MSHLPKKLGILAIILVIALALVPIYVFAQPIVNYPESGHLPDQSITNPDDSTKSN